MGGEQNIGLNANIYNSYNFGIDAETAIVVTFGKEKFTGIHLIDDLSTGIGLLLYPYKQVSNLGCYQIEGRTGSLKFKR